MPFVPAPLLHDRLSRAFTWLLLIGLTFLATAHYHPKLSPPTDGLASPGKSRIRFEVPYEPIDKASIFPIAVLPPLCCFLATVGIGYVAFLRRGDYLWLTNVLFLPGLGASLVGLTLVFFLVYKDGLTAWPLMEAVTAIISGGYFVIFLTGALVARRKHAREMGRSRGGLETGTEAPQIPEVERVTSLKEELLP